MTQSDILQTIAPAFPNDDSFYCRFFSEVSSIKDKAGRYLHEVDFREIEGEEAFKKCPFHDSRKGYLINNSALRQMASEWSEIIEGVEFFSSLFNGQHRDLKNAWRITLTTMFAPLYLLHKGDNPIANGELDTAMAGVFKIMLDVPTTIDLMLMSDGIPSNVSHQDILDFADHALILLNGDYACAGSPKLIDDVNKRLYSDLSGEFNKQSKWDTQFPDQNEFLKFCYLMSTQYVCSQIYQITTAILMETIAQKIGHFEEESNEKMSAYERRRRYALQAVKQGDKAEVVFDNFVSLINESFGWNVDVQKSAAPTNVMNASLKILNSSNIQSPEDLLNSYQEYQNFVQIELQKLQTVIAETIHSETLFEQDFRFVKDADSHPAQKLSQKLNIA